MDLVLLERYANVLSLTFKQTHQLSYTATIVQLAARKQRYKLGMFKWLYRILMMTVLMVAIFFVVSSMTFSGRLAEGQCCTLSLPNPTCIHLTHRLRRSIVEGTVVAARRLAVPPFPGRFHCYCVSVAPNTQQPPTRDVRRARARRRGRRGL